MDSETEGSDRPSSPATTRNYNVAKREHRSRSGTVSSSQTTGRSGKSAGQSQKKRDHSTTPKPVSPNPAHDETEPPMPGSTPSSPTALSPVSYVPSTPSVTVASTEDSDTDFQSAYSVSPRESFFETDGMRGGDDSVVIADNGGFLHEDSAKFGRERASSAATAKPPSGQILRNVAAVN